MNPRARFTAMLIGLVLLLTITPSWGQTPTCHFPGCNPTVSDVNRNTAGGSSALVSVDQTATGGVDNTAFGFAALGSNTTGVFNTASGSFALSRNTTGLGNTAVGAAALELNITGDLNTAVGSNVLVQNTTGANNTAAGNSALFFNTTGANNTAVGVAALEQNTTGTANTVSGAFALFNNTTGTSNTANGFEALRTNNTGIKNTAVGAGALSLSTGNKNIAIGFNAGTNLLSGNNNVYLSSLGGDSSESQTMRLGKEQTRTFIAGIATATVTGATVQVDTTTGQLGIMTSSARYKRDIAPMGTRSDKMLDLQPVIFAYKDDAQGVTRYGLIAEDVATVYPELVTRTATGEVQTVRYHELIPMLLNELQREHQEVAKLKHELAELRSLMGSRQGQ